MNIFSVGDGRGYELTRENFLEHTHKRYPFFQDPKKHKKPYFAICPECNNPIQIINLYGKEYEEEHTGKTDMHGRHFIYNIDGLPKYNQARYNKCSLHKPISFKIVKVRRDETINEEIRNIIENNRDKIYKHIVEITGFLFKKDKVNTFIDEYLIARNYCFTHTNRFNIPYSILYTNKAINLFGKRIEDSEVGMEIENAINCNGKYFEVKENLIKKKTSKYVLLKLVVIKHRVLGSKQFLTIRIEEEFMDKCGILFEKEIEIRQYVYE